MDFKSYGLTELIAILHYKMIHFTLHPILVYNISVFLCSLVITALTFYIFRNISFFTRNEAFYITAITAVLPYLYFNLIGFAAVYLYVAFLLGLACIIKWNLTGSWIWRIAALVLFFISFYYHSHISYYLVALVLLWYLTRKPVKAGTLLLKNADFVLLPVVFVVIQRITFAMYDGPKDLSYNSFGVQSIIALPKNLLHSFQKSFLELFEISADITTQMIYFLLLVLVLPLVYLLVKSVEIPFVNEKIRLLKNWKLPRSVYLLVLGVLLFLLGAFPFTLAGKPPVFYENGAAYIHQCNLYLGSALIIYALVVLLVRQNFQRAVLAVIMSCFILANFKNVVLHNKQWIKEEALLEHIKNNPFARNNQTFLIDDNAEELNSSYRLQIATLNGIFRRAFNDEQSRFVISRSELNDFLKKKNSTSDSLNFENANEQYSMRDYRSENFDYNIVIDKTDKYLSDQNTVKLILYSVFKEQQFRNEAKEFVKLSFIPCETCPRIVD